MPLHCFYSKTKFARVYFHLPGGADPRKCDKDAIWEQVKRQHFYIDPGRDEFYFDDAEQETAEKAADKLRADIASLEARMTVLV